MEMSQNLQSTQNEQEEFTSEIVKLLGKLIFIYQNKYSIEFPGALLQYSHLYDLYTKILIDYSQHPQNNFDIIQNFLIDARALFSSLSMAIMQPKHTVNNFVVGPMDDKRFNNPAWQHNLYFSTLKQFYYLMAKYSLRWLKSLGFLDKKSRQQLHLYIKNGLNFMSPSNGLWTNPEVLRTTIASGGENLIKGFKNYLEDLVLNSGRPNVRMTDTKAFQVGKNIAITPGKVIYQNDLMQLIQYTATTKEVYEIPILFVPPWINKYYILDLSPDNSLVKWLVEQGFTVFMISWVNPGAELAHKEFSDYMKEGPLEAIDIILSKTQCPSIHTVGYCIGGTLLSCALAVLESRNEKKIASASFFMTLLNFSNPGELGIFIDKTQLDALDKIMKIKGYLNGRLLDMAFNVLRPNDLIWPYFINHYLLGEKTKPFDILYWNSDSSNLPYKMYSFYLRNMYLHNALYHPNKLVLDNIPIDLSQIKVPAFFLASETDHITLWRSVYRSTFALGGPKEFVLSGSGHVAGVINPPYKNKYHYKIRNRTHVNEKLPMKTKDWLKDSIEHKGSWWPYWKEWLKTISSKKIAEVPLKNDPFLEDAPGSYVQKKI